MRIGLTRYKNRGFNCEWFARIDSRESRCESPVPLRLSGYDHRRKIHPKKSTQNKIVHLNTFFWTISVGLLTRITEKKAKIHANFSKKFAWTRCFFGISGFWVGFCASIWCVFMTLLSFRPSNSQGTIFAMICCRGAEISGLGSTSEGREWGPFSVVLGFRILWGAPIFSPEVPKYLFSGVRQRSGEGVVRRNGCPKGCFWRVRFFSAPLRFSLKTPERYWKP